MSISLIEDPKLEMDLPVTVRTNGGLADATIIPAYCLNCKQQLSGFFHYNGSRYGQVGSIECDHCEVTIFCTDGDNVQHRIFMSPDEYFNRWIYNDENFDGRLKEIDFNELYQINKTMMGELYQRLAARSKAGFLDKKGKMELNELIGITCKKLNIKILPEENIIVDERFPNLPHKVNIWLNLLRVLRII